MQPETVKIKGQLIMVLANPIAVVFGQKLQITNICSASNSKAQVKKMLLSVFFKKWLVKNTVLASIVKILKSMNRRLVYLISRFTCITSLRIYESSNSPLSCKKLLQQMKSATNHMLIYRGGKILSLMIKCAAIE